MDTFAIIAVTLGLMAYLLGPLFTAHNAPVVMRNPDGRMRKSLIRKKEMVYHNIKDLQFEYQMGKVSEEDFNNLDTEYRIEAADVLKQIELMAVKTRNQEIHKTMTHIPGTGQAHRVDTHWCTACGTARIKGHQFCTGCGELLPCKSCSFCGVELKPDMKFCSECGRKVS